jgi:hypothetical protein
MRTFSLFTVDTHYTVPTLTLLTVENEQRAIELAQANLDQSEFHRAVELRDGERAIYLRQKAA